MTFSMVLAGCMDLTDEDVESIVDSIIDLPGCNDETAYNYDENATNNLACLTEAALVSSITEFVSMVNEGPEWGETMAMIEEGSTEMDGQAGDFVSINAVSPNGMHAHTEMIQGFIAFEITQTLTKSADGTAILQVNWMGEEFLMSSATPFDDVWSQSVFDEMFDDDDHEEDHSDDGMVCYDMSTHSVMMEYDNQVDCEDAGYMWTSTDDDDHDGHDHGDHDDHDDHGMAYDWMIVSGMDFNLAGSFDDYSIVLAACTMEESGDDMMGMGGSMTCGDDVMIVSLADATAPGADVMFHDADMSGTITSGDMVHINPEIDAGGEWNTVRLYSTSADSYSDENPMMVPGFGAVAGIVALLGAALLTRRD
jgi:PGF-CTERM protein